MASESPTPPEPWKENNGWRDKQISDKQAQLLHDLTCQMIASLSRGDASDLIQKMLSNPESGFSNKKSFDEDTLEKHK